jgi:drug/metabolite transporter (DMT)-like permease
LAYYLYLKAFNHISAFDVSLAFNMEPIYGIIMAALLLKDYKEVSSMVYLGMIIIISLVFLDTDIKFKKGKIEREADSIDII